MSTGETLDNEKNSTKINVKYLTGKNILYLSIKEKVVFREIDIKREGNSKI